MKEFGEKSLIECAKFGIVWKAIERNDKKIYAIKKIALNDKQIKSISKELFIFSRLKSSFKVNKIAPMREHHFLT